MTFFNTAVDSLSTIVNGLGISLAIWGIVNLLEGYGNDNAGAKSQGIKQFVAGAGVVVVGTSLIPMLKDLFVI